MADVSRKVTSTSDLLAAPQHVAEASERDCRLARRKADATASWGAMTFYRCKARLTIVRIGYGDDDGGWRYHDLKTLESNWHEIVSVAWKIGEVHEREGKQWVQREPLTMPAR